MQHAGGSQRASPGVRWQAQAVGSRSPAQPWPRRAGDCPHLLPRSGALTLGSGVPWIGTLGVVLRSASGSGFPPPRPASPRGGSEQELEGRGPRPARAHRGRGRLGDDPCPRRPRPMRCRAWGAAQSRREQLGFRRLGPCAMAAGPLTRAAARPVRGAVGTCAPALLPNSDPFWDAWQMPNGGGGVQCPGLPRSFSTLVLRPLTWGWRPWWL